MVCVSPVPLGVRYSSCCYSTCVLLLFCTRAEEHMQGSVCLCAYVLFILFFLVELVGCVWVACVLNYISIHEVLRTSDVFW